ncbi:MAG TPA: YciI family protein [Thermomicrobiales bacterium]|nr:YciI family protein [Thermomicrobiales bacterium]
MMLIYQNTEAWNALAEEERQAMMEEAGEIWGNLMATGEVVSGEALAAPTLARTIRVREGVSMVTDGPFIEAKEQLAGLVVFDVASEERAIEIATGWPDARYWAVELRPLMHQGGEA